MKMRFDQKKPFINLKKNKMIDLKDRKTNILNQNKNSLNSIACKEAIDSWSTIKKEYSEIEKTINTKHIFYLDKETCISLNDQNDAQNFHAYVGVRNSKLILIMVPLDIEGNEKQLDQYLFSTLTELKQEIKLIEKKKIITTLKTTLSKDIDIVSCKEEVEIPFSNQPLIKEKISVSGIEMWKDQGLDWFYKEIVTNGGESIFNVFNIPLTDLIRENQKYNEVICFFAFNYSTLYEKSMPTLIFVANDNETSEAEIINDFEGETSISTIYDWSRPCPPFCKNKSKYKLLT